MNGRARTWAGFTVACTAMLLLAGVARAETFCAGPITGSPESSYPTIDGLIEGDDPFGQASDTGWTGSSAIARSDGIDIPRITWRAGTKNLGDGRPGGTNLFLGVTFDAFTEFSYDDAVVIAFEVDPTAWSSTYHKLIVYPSFENQLGDSATPKHPRELRYYTGVLGGAGTITWSERTVNPWYVPTEAVTDAHWVEAAVRQAAPTQNNSSPTRWELELRLPIKTSAASRMGIPLPKKIYFFAHDTHPQGNDGKELWPPGQPESGNIVKFPSSPAAFGPFSQGGCTGLAIYAADLGTNHTKAGLPSGPVWASTYIDRFLPNKFKATVHNNTGAPVNDIGVVFFLANFGVPGEPSWRKVPAAKNPTVPASVATPFSDLWTAEWVFTDGDRTRYPAGASHCLRAELLPPASGPTVNFVAKTAWTNIMFLSSNSPFQGSAEISALGYDAPRVGAQKQRFSLDVSRSAQLAQGTGYAPKVERGRAVAQSVIRIRAYRDALGYVIINGNRYEYQDPAGSFMYVVERPLPAPLASRIPPKYFESLRPKVPILARGSARLVAQPESTLPEVALPADVARDLEDAVKPARWSEQLVGIERSATVGGRYVVDVEPGRTAEITLQGQYADDSPPPDRGPNCFNCHKAPSGASAALLVFGLAALSPLRRRRR